MENIDLIKYIFFLFSSTILLWWLKLWLKKNKERRENTEEKNQEN